MPRSLPSRALSLTALTALTALLPACGETNIQAIRRLQPLYAVQRSALEETLRLLPPPGRIRAWALPESMTPPPGFTEERMNDPRVTAEILQIEDLEHRQNPFSLSIRSALRFCLDWTGPNNPLDPSVHDTRSELGPECEAAVNRPWLILIRTVDMRLPEALRMEAFVIDRRLNRLVAALSVDVWGRYTKADVGRGPWSDEGNRTASSAFHEAAGCELSMQLSRLPGANIQFDHRRCEGRFREIATPASLAPRVAVPEGEGEGEPPRR